MVAVTNMQPSKLGIFQVMLIPEILFTARSELWNWFCLLAPSVGGFLFVYEIARKPLNGFVPNSHGRRVWSLARTSLTVKVKGQGYHG